MDDAAASIRGLQRMEAQRLQLVAAHHAEQSRKLLKDLKDSCREALYLILYYIILHYNYYYIILYSKEGCREACLLDVRRRLGEASTEIDEAVSELRYAAAELP